MAYLSNMDTGEIIVLQTNHTIGRDIETNITVMSNQCISRNHAIFSWDGRTWKIKDISTNGTYVDDSQVIRGQYTSIEINTSISFGGKSESKWKIVSLDAPKTSLIPLSDNLPVINLFDVVVLDEQFENDNITIYLSETEKWVCHKGDEIHHLENGDKVGDNGHFWQFNEVQNQSPVETLDISHVETQIKFQFLVSLNEEHVTLNVAVNGKLYELGERSHHYLLLILARQRIEDEMKNIPESDQGWINKDLLIKMLGMPEQHINIQIHRFRKHMFNTLKSEKLIKQIVERRPCELRFSYSNISIQGGLGTHSYSNTMLDEATE